MIVGAAGAGAPPGAAQTSSQPDDGASKSVRRPDLYGDQGAAASPRRRTSGRLSPTASTTSRSASRDAEPRVRAAFGFKVLTSKSPRCPVRRRAKPPQPRAHPQAGRQRPLLDEPTNDLDVETLAARERPAGVPRCAVITSQTGGSSTHRHAHPAWEEGSSWFCTKALRRLREEQGRAARCRAGRPPPRHATASSPAEQPPRARVRPLPRAGGVPVSEVRPGLPAARAAARTGRPGRRRRGTQTAQPREDGCRMAQHSPAPTRTARRPARRYITSSTWRFGDIECSGTSTTVATSATSRTRV